MMLDIDVLRAFAEDQDLEFLALFGSRARGTARPGSDWDVALMPRRWDAPGSGVDAALALARASGSGDFDTTWLPHASWLLADRVSSEGHLLYEKNPGDFRRFCLGAHLRAADATVWEARQLQGLRRAIYKQTAVDKRLVQDKLSRLVEILRELRQVLDVPRTSYEAEFMRYRTGERSLELLVEYAAAINSEVAAAAGIPPSDYYSSFFSAADAGALDRRLALRLADLAKLRNTVIHAYEKIDVGDTYDRLKASVPDWERYSEAILKFLTESK